MSADDSLVAVQAWIRRLDPDGDFSTEELAALRGALGDRFDFRAREPITQPGERAQFAVLILEGLAARMKDTGRGRRQIVSILTPGDFCSGGLALALPMDYALVALSDGWAARISAEAMSGLQASMPHLMLALGRTLAEEAVITREWVVNMGARNGTARVAHLLCELRWRLEAVGVARSSCLPMSQRDIAEAVGLSLVQVNRVLQRLRRADLIDIGRGRIDIRDPERLAAAAAFDPHYLEVRDTAARSLAWSGLQLSS
jgi:CRP-like cAMP-binding protein